MTAEFAMVLPAVLVVLALCAGAVQVGAAQVRLTDAAADAARMVGRGDGEGAAAGRISAAVDGAAMSVAREGLLVCVTASATTGPASRLVGIPLTARGCAYDDARPGTG